MRSLIATFALILTAGLSLAQTRTVNLEWDPNPPTEGVTGYKVWQKVVTPAPAPAPPVISWKLLGTATETKYAVTGVPVGTSTYAVSAINAGGESARSSEVNATLPAAPRAPQGLRVVTVVVK